jgi:VanZ family protein
MALAFVVGYALFDEFRQSFVPSRTASIFDSLIDMTGGLAALVFIARRKIVRSPTVREGKID